MTTTPRADHRVVFLFDVDNTLLDNDRVTDDLKSFLHRTFGEKCQARFWSIFEALRKELGYADYLGALQRYRVENLREPEILTLSSFLLNYPFAERLYPGALDVLEQFEKSGPVVILTDGDVVFQPRKIDRSGLMTAVDGRVLVYIHKERELDDVMARWSADHYVLVDDKVRILSAVKSAWGSRVTTVFPRQGHYAFDPDVSDYPTPDVTIEKIGDLRQWDIATLVQKAKSGDQP